MRTFLLFFISFISLIFTQQGAAQININNASFMYTQDFDGLANTGTGNGWTNNSTISGWYSNRTTYNAGTGSSNTGAMYSFGSTSSSERALGSVASGSTGTIYYGVRFVNNTETIITQMSLEYVGEQWRNGGNATPQDLTFAYQKGATSLTTGTWTNVSQLTFTSPIATTTAAALDGNLAENRELIQHTIIVNLGIGEEIWFRWEDIDNASFDHGLAVDDFMVSSIVLPVTFAEISAKRVNQKVRLDFATESEVNNDFFTIERSQDGFNFQPIGKMDGSSNSSTYKQYSFVDETPGKGLLYYRVKQTDYDGTIDYSSLVSVSAVKNQVNILYKGFEKNILVETDMDNYTLEIVNISGYRVWYGSSLNGNTEWYGNDLPSGLYLVRVISKEGMVSKQCMF